MERIEALENAIEKKNLIGIYSVFYTVAHGDPNFSTGKFDQIFQYVKEKNIPGFLQEFDGDEFETEEKWDEEYWAFIASTLMDNFCEERIQHLKQIGKKVYPVTTPVRNNTRVTSGPERGRSNESLRQMQRRNANIPNNYRVKRGTVETADEEKFEDSLEYKLGKRIYDITHGRKR